MPSPALSSDPVPVRPPRDIVLVMRAKVGGGPDAPPFEAAPAVILAGIPIPVIEARVVSETKPVDRMFDPTWPRNFATVVPDEQAAEITLRVDANEDGRLYTIRQMDPKPWSAESGGYVSTDPDRAEFEVASLPEGGVRLRTVLPDGIGSVVHVDIDPREVPALIAELAAKAGVTP